MKIGVLMGVLMSALLAAQNSDIRLRADASARQGPDASAGQTPDAHVAIARSAAGDTYQNLFNFLCTAPGARGGAPRAGGAPGNAAPRAGAPPGGAVPGGTAPRGGGRGPATPERSTWYAEPVKVFDNLYFVGQSEYSAWAVTTSDGIILIDTLFDYSVEEEVGNGLTKLGLDPATIKYAVVTHPHPDHHGGAKFLQDRYKTRVLMSAADWDVIDRLTGTKPARDMVATDGQQLTLGDTTVTLYVTPGHTPGTISVVMPVRDSDGTRHVAALWGGTGLNADRESLEQYIRSAKRFSDIVQKAGADIILSNHTDWDQSKINLPRLASRAPAGRDLSAAPVGRGLSVEPVGRGLSAPADRAPNPYVVGTAAARRFLTVAEECATARLMRVN